ncbi:hypothetical protein PC118_g153 [Phytophthora cactorum]|uniref:PX domain-containing protein n=1 Tax=Phytophthora cactorum TaxID=29920 RepID=A0A8T1GNA7_9STRA|nr:hypothetical protein PC118_g153 [Phytophthora cactorum]
MPAVDEYPRASRRPPTDPPSRSRSAAGSASGRNLSATFQHQVQVRPGANSASLRASYQDPQSHKKRHSNSKKSSHMRHSLTHVQSDAPASGRSSASSYTSNSALSPPQRGSNHVNVHTTSRDLSPHHQLHPEYPAASPAGDDILKVEIPRWKSKLTTDRADRLHIPAGADSAGNSPVGSGAGRSSTWNGKDGRGGHGGSMGALVLGRDRDNGSKKRYTVFQVYVHYQSGAVRVSEKRYSHFRELHKTLRRKYATVGKLYFPPKKFFMSLSLRVIEQRREAIETYMNAVLTLRPRPIEVVQFLSTGSSSVESEEEEDGNSTDGAARGVDMVTAPKHVQSTSTALATSSRISDSNSFTSEEAGGHMVTMQDFEILKMLGKGIDWKLLENRGIKPPFKPRVRSPTDIQNFDREFTKELPDHGFLQQDKRLAVSPKNEFQGFSYTRIEEPASLSRESSSKREKRRSGRRSEPRISEGIERESADQQYPEFGLYKKEEAGMEPIRVEFFRWETRSTL